MSMFKGCLDGGETFISSVILAALFVCPGKVFAAEQTTEKAVEKAVDKALERAAEKPLKQEERLEKWRGPTKLHYLVYVADIYSIDGANQSFSANFCILIRWHDRRLAEDAESIRQLPLETDSLWNGVSANFCH